MKAVEIMNTQVETVPVQVRVISKRKIMRGVVSMLPTIHYGTRCTLACGHTLHTPRPANRLRCRICEWLREGNITSQFLLNGREERESWDEQTGWPKREVI